MNLEQLMGRYFRLKQELAAVDRIQPGHAGRLDRIADDLAATARAIAALQPLDEQCDESVLSFGR